MLSLLIPSLFLLGPKIHTRLERTVFFTIKIALIASHKFID